MVKSLWEHASRRRIKRKELTLLTATYGYILHPINSYIANHITGELMTILKKRVCGASILAALLSASAFAATNFVRTDLIADSAGAAAITDHNLVGSWG